MFGVISLYDIIPIKFTINGYRWAYVIFCSTRTIISIFNYLYCLLNYYVWSPCCCFVVFLIRLPAKQGHSNVTYCSKPRCHCSCIFRQISGLKSNRACSQSDYHSYILFFNSGRIRIVITACNCANETAINIL